MPDDIFLRVLLFCGLSWCGPRKCPHFDQLSLNISYFFLKSGLRDIYSRLKDIHIAFKMIELIQQCFSACEEDSKFSIFLSVSLFLKTVIELNIKETNQVCVVGKHNLFLTVKKFDNAESNLVLVYRIKT